MMELTVEQIKKKVEAGGMFAWEMRAARNECDWVCASCCQSFIDGMPESCPNNAVDCTEIIQRDKRWAKLAVTPESPPLEMPLVPYRKELLDTALKCGAKMTGKPDGTQSITIVFSIEAWRAFDIATREPTVSEG